MKVPPALKRRLRVRLRRDLDISISDSLIGMMVNDYVEFEIARLYTQVAIIDLPGEHQYFLTINDINKINKELSLWQLKDAALLSQEVDAGIERCFQVLRDNMKDDMSALYIEWDDIDKHSFYYTSLLVLYKYFKGKFNAHSPNSKILVSPQHVAVYCLMNPSPAQMKGEEQKILSDYISKNDLILDTKGRESFERSIRRYRSVTDWTVKTLNNRISLLESIETYITEKHPGHLAAFKKELKFLRDELTELE